jgi:hypothetical protein
VAPDLQNWWHRFWAVCLFRCEGASPEIQEISPEIPDFPETPEKSSEYPSFINKFVLSGDFQDSPIHSPLGDIKILSHIFRVCFEWLQLQLEPLYSKTLGGTSPKWSWSCQKWVFG